MLVTLGLEGLIESKDVYWFDNKSNTFFVIFV